MLSIIIPSYNRCELLQATVASIKDAVLAGGHEIIVVDDGSDDGTMAYLEGEAGVKVLQQANAGPAAARNLGAAHAGGEYLAFLDSDDVWFPWTLETYLEVIDETRAAFIAGKPYRFQDTAELSAVEHRPTETIGFADYLASGDEWRWWGCSSFVIQKEAFAAAGGFRHERMNAEDADMALRLGTAKGFVQITEPATFGYREHAVSEMKNAAMNIKGTRYLLETQLAGKYPGGSARRMEQWRIVSRHLRPVAVAGLGSVDMEARAFAWQIYRATLPHHLRSMRWKFVVGVLLKALRR